MNTAIAWFGFISIILLFIIEVTNIRLRVKRFFAALTDKTPSVQNDVRVLMAERVNLNADPLRPDDRVAAVNEYRQHRHGL